MSTILSQQIIDSSTATVESYSKTAQDLYNELAQAISGLIGTGFVGDGADGFNTFFTTKIAPALTENLTAGDTSLMGALKKMMIDIGTQFLQTIDPAIGKANADAGSASGQAE